MARKKANGVVRTPSEELHVAVELAGGRRQLGEMAGVTRQCVDKWVWAGRVSFTHAPKLERLFPGEVSRERLRPDLFA